MSSVLNTLKGYLSPSPRPNPEKSRPKGQQTIEIMFSHQRALNASRQTLTPPSLTTASSAEDRSSEPKDPFITPREQSTPTNILKNSLETNDDVKTNLFHPNPTGTDAGPCNVSGAILVEAVDHAEQELLTTSMDGLDPLWGMGQMAMGNPPVTSEGQIQDTRQASKAMKVLGSAAQRAKKAIGKSMQHHAQPEVSKTAASSRPQRSSPKRPDLHAVTQDTPSFETPSIEEPARKRLRPSENGKQKEATQQNLASTPQLAKKPTKPWLHHGLFLGQDFTDSKPKSKHTLVSTEPEKKLNSILPRPMFAKGKLLEDPHAQLDFKLPFDVFSPLPPGQPKPDDWKKSTRNQFSDDAAAVWKKMKHVEHSACSCNPQIGCDEGCVNRHMMYECDDSNCNVGQDKCANRPFADLRNRIKAECTKSGQAYNIGVETVKTADRGFGIRATRSFEPGQIITEYNGEIITRDECQMRMHTKYKDEKCYYLMDFEQNMVLDATKGSVARFVNHSCAPNCRMEKYTVNNVPRVALFAGDKGITTGDELTYDYKFCNFSMENVQKCYCGAENCRGYLGKKPKEAKEPKDALNPLTTRNKRKVGDMLEGAVDGIKEAIGVTKKPKLMPKAPKTGVAVAESSKPKKLTKQPKPAKEKPLPKGWIYPDQPADFTKKIFEADPEAVLRANKRKRKAEEKGATVQEPAPKRPKPSEASEPEASEPEASEPEPFEPEPFEPDLSMPAYVVEETRGGW